MAFATFPEFVERFGAVRFANTIDGSAVEKQAIAEGYLTTTSQTIVSAAVTGGFSTPITGTDLSPDDPVVAAEIDQVFLDKTVIMTTALFIQPVDETNRVEVARASCKEWLESLEMGQGLPVTPPVRAGSVLANIQPVGAGIGVTTQGMRLSRSVGL